ncbi:hypothetical protein EXIGLDRAFT_760702 [Exidia glandulosa HHB12029]|uniref:Sensitive to high expression protein 9, mitochondrial n=1 Tax=Exidia glandulosa HHB12029 TaxID=1314781 RepID=A0A165P0Y1_EXIGL|nr:hypothetical protein EXIGLDRAFT_760702 [Exidia glandulosa HHB12029]
MNRVTAGSVSVAARHRLLQRPFAPRLIRWQSSSSPQGEPDRPSFLDKLRGWTTLRGQVVQERVGGFVSSANSNFAHWGALLNRMSGYDEIHALKQAVVDNEARISRVRHEARALKEAFDKAATARAASQREVNDLLQRKASWSEADVMRFTALVRADHELEQEETRSKDAAEKAEDEVERALSTLTGSILARYHEEQVWSDKIRRLSTYGQLGAMGLNVVVFVLAIVLVEPWKRKRLGETFERRVEELERDHTALVEQSIAMFRSTLESQGKILESLAVGSDGTTSDERRAVEERGESPPRLDSRRRSLGDEELAKLAGSAAVGGAIGAAVISLIVYLTR